MHCGINERLRIAKREFEGRGMDVFIYGNGKLAIGKRVALHDFQAGKTEVFESPAFFFDYGDSNSGATLHYLSRMRLAGVMHDIESVRERSKRLRDRGKAETMDTLAQLSNEIVKVSVPKYFQGGNV